MWYLKIFYINLPFRFFLVQWYIWRWWWQWGSIILKLNIWIFRQIRWSIWWWSGHGRFWSQNFTSDIWDIWHLRVSHTLVVASLMRMMMMKQVLYFLLTAKLSGRFHHVRCMTHYLIPHLPCFWWDFDLSNQIILVRLWYSILDPHHQHRVLLSFTPCLRSQIIVCILHSSIFTDTYDSFSINSVKNATPRLYLVAPFAFDTPFAFPPRVAPRGTPLWSCGFPFSYL